MWVLILQLDNFQLNIVPLFELSYLVKNLGVFGSLLEFLKIQFILVQAHKAYAILLQLGGVVSLRHHQNPSNVFHIYKLADVAAHNLAQPRNHEIVRVNQQVHQIVHTHLFSHLKLVRVQILDYLNEILFGNSLN